MNIYQYLYEDYENNKKLSNSSIDFIMSHKFPKYESFDWPKKMEYNGECLVHNTYWNNLDSIIENGITLNTNRSNSFTWAVNINVGYKESEPFCYRHTGYGNCSIIFKTSPDYVEILNDNQYGIEKDIKPEDIVSIDIPFIDEHIYGTRISEIPNDIKEYGLDTVLDVYNDSLRLDFITKEQFHRLMNWCIENS